jgi:hypothetical protein
MLLSCEPVVNYGAIFPFSKKRIAIQVDANKDDADN